MTGSDFASFLEAHTAQIEPLSRELHLAYWRATISGDAGDYRRFGSLELQYQTVYSDHDGFARLRSWRDSGAVTDPVQRRALDVLYRDYLAHQVDHALLERMTTLSSEVLSRFNTYRAEVDGRELSGNEVRSVLRESTDDAWRRRVWEADKAVGRLVRDSLLELVDLRNESARQLGFDNYYTMSLALAEQDEDDLFALFDRLAELTGGPFLSLKTDMDAALARRLGLDAADLRPWHYHDPFFQEAPRVGDVDFDRFYSGRDVVELVAGFFDGVGLDVRDVLSRSDLYERPGKEQHAYCMDIDRRGDVRVLANVRDNEDWTGTMLHELGHAVYDLYISPDLPFVLRQHAHVFVTEAIAMLFGRLSKNPRWIQAMTGIDDAMRESIAGAAERQMRLAQLVFARWCQVMVRFERLLYEDPGRDLNQAWWELVERYQGIAPVEGRDEPDWAAKIHIVSAPVYYHNYMLGELLASQLAAHMREQITGVADGDGAMVGSREVGTYLRESVFAPGRLLRWDELVRRATGAPITADAFVAQFVGDAG